MTERPLFVRIAAAQAETDAKQRERELLARLAASSYPTAPECPYDGHELDIHFHGGVECPQCGSEFELGQDDRLLPSLHTLGEDASSWPNTLPWGQKEQDYYRTAMAERTGDPSLDKLIEQFMATAAPQVMYHVAPQSQRESIMTNGLDNSKANFTVMDQGGSWLHDSLDKALGYVPHVEAEHGPVDVWEVQPGAPTIDHHGDESEFWHPGVIEPSRLRLLDAPASSPEAPRANETDSWSAGPDSSVIGS
jgi:hypothetical protein